MKKIFFLMLISAAAFTACKQEEKVEITKVMTEEKKPEKVLRHVVMFKYKDTTTEADIQSVNDAFAALPSKIEQIKGYEFGTNNSPEGLDKGFTHCYFLTFHSEEDRAVYLPHPDHKAFGELLGPFLDDVMVIDYWTTD
ncbi:MAG: Dabb family protein [Spirosomaceae bacterium]|nr:Dabb family protein [Spirosomataceae bacterium]